MGIDDEHAKYWLVVSYVDEEVEEEWHYCSWACLAADAEIQAEEEAKQMQACRNVARQFRLVFRLRRMRKGGMVMLRATGIVRQVDNLGRVVIPKEIRTGLEYREGQPLEFFVQENGDVVLRKYERGCTFCGNVEGVKEFRQKLVCAACVAEMK